MTIDPSLWAQCEGEWGQGPGYRDRVARWNQQWFSADPRQRLERELFDVISREWDALLKRLCALLDTMAQRLSARHKHVFRRRHSNRLRLVAHLNQVMSFKFLQTDFGIGAAHKTTPKLPPSRLSRFGGTRWLARTKLARECARAKSGAEEGIRTPAVLRPPAPQANGSDGQSKPTPENRGRLSRIVAD